MRPADIDVKTDKDLYGQLRQYFESGMVRSFATKKEALAWAGKTGWCKYVLCVNHRFYRQWHVGMRVTLEDKPGMYIFWFPTGNYVTVDGEQRMELVQGVCGINEYEAARLPASA